MVKSNVVYVSESSEPQQLKDQEDQQQPSKLLKKRSSVVRLVKGNSGEFNCVAPKTKHAFASFSHGDFDDSSTVNLLDDPVLMETAV